MKMSFGGRAGVEPTFASILRSFDSTPSMYLVGSYRRFAKRALQESGQPRGVRLAKIFSARHLFERECGRNCVVDSLNPTGASAARRLVALFGTRLEPAAIQPSPAKCGSAWQLAGLLSTVYDCVAYQMK